MRANLIVPKKVGFSTLPADCRRSEMEPQADPPECVKEVCRPEKPRRSFTGRVFFS